MTSESTLTRLRRSNPVVQTPRLDADELFARITALPGDDRLAGRPVRRRGRRARRRRTRKAVGLMPSALAAWLGVRSSQATRTRASRSSVESDRSASPSCGSSSNGSDGGVASAAATGGRDDLRASAQTRLRAVAYSQGSGSLGTTASRRQAMVIASAAMPSASWLPRRRA